MLPLVLGMEPEAEPEAEPDAAAEPEQEPEQESERDRQIEQCTARNAELERQLELLRERRREITLARQERRKRESRMRIHGLRARAMAAGVEWIEIQREDERIAESQHQSFNEYRAIYYEGGEFYVGLDMLDSFLDTDNMRELFNEYMEENFGPRLREYTASVFFSERGVDNLRNQHAQAWLMTDAIRPAWGRFRAPAPAAEPAAAEPAEPQPAAAAEPEPAPEPEPTEREQQLEEKQEEMRELQENLRTSCSPDEIRSYMDTYADLSMEIQQLSVPPTAITRDDAPRYLCCLITWVLMEDPVIDTSNGYTYDRSSIIEHMRVGNLECPFTRQPMGPLIPNRAVRDAVEQWCADNNVNVTLAPATTGPSPAPSTTGPASAPIPGSIQAPTHWATEPVNPLIMLPQIDDVAVAENLARQWLTSISALGLHLATFSNIYVPFIHAVFQTQFALPQRTAWQRIFGEQRWNDLVERYRAAMTG
eukprot:SAG11_NODE_5440_length_1559_cov_2.223288_1_plen_478_part_01